MADDKLAVVNVKKRKRYPDRSAKLAKAIFGVPWGRMESREDREAIALVLLRSDSDKLQALAQEALLPQFKQSSFATLCNKFGVSFKEVATAYMAVKKDEGFMRVANHLPDLMEETAEAARNTWERCTDCDGKGALETVDKKSGRIKRVVCKPCRGLGKVYVLGNTERLELIFENWVSDKRIGPGVNVNLDLRSTGRREALEDTSAAVGTILDAQEDAP